MKNYWKKFKTFWKEIGNLLTNIACPFLSIANALLELFGAPITWIQMVKKAEYGCGQACGTKEEIDRIVKGIDEIISDANQEEQNGINN